MRAFKGHFNKANAAFTERLAAYKASPGVKEIYRQLVESYDKLKKQYDKCDSQYQLMQELEPSQEGWILKYDETYELMDTAMAEYNAAVLDFTKRAAGTDLSLIHI